MQNFAKRLILSEANGSRSEIKDATAFRAIDKLRPHLATLMGNAGFRALLSRALALATMEVPLLRAVQVLADGTLEGLDKLEAKVVQDEIFEGRVELLAQLLGLMVTFIGEALMLQVVREVWPKLSLNEFDYGKGSKNEKS